MRFYDKEVNKINVITAILYSNEYSIIHKSKIDFSQEIKINKITGRNV